jgi:glycosyltransferase involved in cell wall biosynthesis
MSILRRLFTTVSKPWVPGEALQADAVVGDSPGDIQPPSGAAEAPQALLSVLPEWASPCLAGFLAAEPRLAIALEADRRRNMMEKATDAWERIVTSGYRANRTVLEPPPKAVVVMSWLKRGGAEYVGANLLKEAQAAYGVDQVLLILTDHDVIEAPDWLDPRTRLFDLPRDCHWLSKDEQAALVTGYLLSTAPQAIFNCNSGMLWNLWRDDAAAFAVSSRLYGFIFCYEYSPAGNLLGYAASHLDHCIEHLSGVLTDNSWFFSELRKTLAYPERWGVKFKTLHQPVAVPDPARPIAAPTADQPPKILWASRICPQKRPDLLLAVARLCPRLDFDVYGDFYNYGAAYFDESFFAGIGNVTYRGSYTMLQDLPTQDYAAFLYTAAYDGLPNVLLAAGALGLPIVASNVGGIGDLIDNAHGWLVQDVDRPAAYAEALAQAAGERDLALGRAGAMLDRIRGRHSQAAYRQRLASLGLFDGA